MRILEATHIPFEVINYPVDDQHIDAISVAQQVGLDPLQVCKTVVTTTDNNTIVVFCLPAPYEISLKKAKVVAQTKSLDLVDLGRLRSLTGYIRGGVSPRDLGRPYIMF